MAGACKTRQFHTSVVHLLGNWESEVHSLSSTALRWSVISTVAVTPGLLHHANQLDLLFQLLCFSNCSVW